MKYTTSLLFPKGSSTCSLKKPDLPTIFFTAYVVILLSQFIGTFHFIFGPAVLESGDFAANALQISNAGKMKELLGNYSRWHFHHPGPAFFYAYALGESIFFKVLHIVKSPHQAHVLAGIILQSFFVALSACLCALTCDSKRAASSLVLAVIVVLGLTSFGSLSSIWPPHVLFGPFLLLVIAAAAASRGQDSGLVALTLASGFCIHGHVAQAALTVPVATYGAMGWVLSTDRNWRPHLRTLIWLLAIGFVFALPILINAAFVRPSNIQEILGYLHANQDPRPSFHVALRYILGFWLFDPYPEITAEHGATLASAWHASLFLCLSTLAVFFTPLGQRTSGYRNIFLAAFLALAMSIFWATRITGPLYEFNSFYVYALVAISLFLIMEGLAALLQNYAKLIAPSTFLLAGTFIIMTYRPHTAFSSGETYALPSPIMPSSRGKSFLISVTTESWPMTTALTLELEREGASVHVSKEWDFMFGKQHSLDVLSLNTISNPIFINARQGENPPKQSPLGLNAFCIPAMAQRKYVGDHSIGEALRDCSLASFSTAEPSGDFVFSLGRGAALQFKANRSDRMTLQLSPFLGGNIKEQHIEVLLSGKQIYSATLKNSASVEAELDCDLCTLEIRTPNAFSPVSEGISADGRELGFALQRLAIRPGN
ncbi:hypothetical protein [Xanthomonas sp. GPE 39]|uniref:hypothetical protein n=1 Tax=Xanthomonas sp. GPE 39 TaxID=1583099 RepID=UPI000AF72F5C|nr:hypothetical protein [Xanthomonas sp. GPE 39]